MILVEMTYMVKLVVPPVQFAKCFSSKNRMIDRSRGEWKTAKFHQFPVTSLLVDTSGCI